MEAVNYQRNDILIQLKGNLEHCNTALEFVHIDMEDYLSYKLHKSFDTNKIEKYKVLLQKYFIFCLQWSI